MMRWKVGRGGPPIELAREQGKSVQWKQRTSASEVFMNNHVRIEEELERQSRAPRVVESLLGKQAEARMHDRSQKRREEKACWVDWRPVPASGRRTVNMMEDEGI